MQRRQTGFLELGFPDQQPVLRDVGNFQIQRFGDPQPCGPEQRDQRRIGLGSQPVLGAKLKGALASRCRTGKLRFSEGNHGNAWPRKECDGYTALPLTVDIDRFADARRRPTSRCRLTFCLARGQNGRGELPPADSAPQCRNYNRPV